MKKVYLLPNLFTTASLFFGIQAIIETYQGDFERACWFVLISTALDVLDGKIARLTRTVSSFGISYDSLSDLIAFGVAPALLLYAKLSLGNSRVAAGVAILYVICGALRLARFNVQATTIERKTFTGLPIPAAAGTIVTFYLAFSEIQSPFVYKIVPIMAVIISYLMVSKIPYPSLKNVGLEKRKPFDFLVSIIIILCGFIILRVYKEIILFAFFLIYDLWGFKKVLLGKKHIASSIVPSEINNISLKK